MIGGVAQIRVEFDAAEAVLFHGPFQVGERVRPAGIDREERDDEIGIDGAEIQQFAMLAGDAPLRRAVAHVFQIHRQNRVPVL